MELRSAVRDGDATSNPASGIRALARGVSIIDRLAQNDGGPPLTQIARRARLSKSSTPRLLQTLVGEGFVVRDGGTSRYRLGLKLLWLASDLVEGLGLDRLVGPVLEELAQATGKTVHIAFLDRDVAVYVNPIRRMYSRVGRRIPFHCTGLGKAMLAPSPVTGPSDPRLRRIAAPHRPHHRRNQAAVENLAAVRAHGYALDEEEHEEGIRCIAPRFLTGAGKSWGRSASPPWPTASIARPSAHSGRASRSAPTKWR